MSSEEKDIAAVRAELKAVSEKLDELIKAHNPNVKWLEVFREAHDRFLDYHWYRWLMWLRPIAIPAYKSVLVRPIIKRTDRRPVLRQNEDRAPSMIPAPKRPAYVDPDTWPDRAPELPLPDRED